MEENHRVNKNDISTLRLPTYNEWVLKVGRSKSKDRNKSLKAKKKESGMRARIKIASRTKAAYRKTHLFIEENFR